VTDDTNPQDQLSPGARWLLEDVRASKPRIDWARVEAKLFDERGAVRDHGHQAPRALTMTALLTGFAAAAGFALMFSSGASSSRGVPPPAHEGAIASVVFERDGSSQTAHPGDVLKSGTNGASIHSAGRLDVQLAPNTQVALMSDGERILLRLDQGSVAAEVVPVKGGEPFAVDVDGRRVAVHGTKLLVSKSGALEVAVSEGSAVVGVPRGDARTEGPIVCGGCVGDFGATTTIVRDPSSASSLVSDALHAKVAMNDDAPTASVVPAPVPAITDDTSDVAPSPTPSPNANVAPKSNAATVPTTVTNAPVPPPPPAPGLSAAQYQPTLSSLAHAVAACIPRRKGTFSFQTTMTITIAPSGAVTDQSFDPGLDTPVRACALAAIGSTKFPTAEGKTTASAVVVGGTK
jgi:hypothetical protein